MLIRFISTTLMICFAFWPKHTVGRPVHLVDLTYALTNETPVFPGYTRWQLGQKQQVLLGRTTKYFFHDFSSPEHLGTHMDAPSHMNETNWTIDQIPIERLTGSAVVINITERASEDPDTGVELNDIERWEEQNGRIPNGSVVIMHSGWGKYWQNETEYLGISLENGTNTHFPGFTGDACKWLINERSIFGIGVDTISADIGTDISFPCHYIMLDNNLFILENLANLDKLPPVGVVIRAYPMNIYGGTGAPTRVIASI